MKKLNRKGFTLIELLAVIVVLAIVAVLATSQILPLLEKTRKNAFAAEANTMIDAASKAMTLINIGDKTAAQAANKLTPGTDKVTYCFELTKLKALGVLEKDLDNGVYLGKVTVEAYNDLRAYEYTVTMKNSQFSVNKKGSVTFGDVSSPAATVSTSC